MSGQNNQIQGATQTTQAPSWQLPYQQYGANQALGQYKSVSSPTQLVAPFSPQQNQAITNFGNMAATGTPGMAPATGYVNSVLSGSPANNPYLNSEFNQAADSVQNRMESEFGGAGRNVIGSLPVQTSADNNLAADLYGGAYSTGVQQQEQALGMVPSLGSTALNTNSALMGAGQQVQGLAQQYITAPQQFLQQYLSSVNGNQGQATQITGQANPWTGAAGGASLGNSIGTAIGNAVSSGGGSTGGDWGSLVGGLLGYMGG